MEKLKYGERLAIYNPIDVSQIGKTWGTQARVFLGEIFHESQRQHVAVKIMRTDADPETRTKYQESFLREIRILSRLNQELPAMTPMIDCGIIYPSKPIEISDDLQTFEGVTGKVKHFGKTGLMQLHDSLPSESGNFIAYLALEIRDGLEINLNEIIVDNNHVEYLLPIPNVLSISRQIMEVLQEAHIKNVIYVDSRPIHFYISFQNNGRVKLHVIDWNASTILEEAGLDDSYKQKDFKGIVANILFPLFTGWKFTNASIDKKNYNDALSHLHSKYVIGDWKKNDIERLDESIRTLLTESIVVETITTPEQFIERLDHICDSWSCKEDSEFVQAIHNLHMAYNYLNESQRLFEKLTEDLFRSGGLSQKKKETERLFFLVDNMKKTWLLYPNQIRKKH